MSETVKKWIAENAQKGLAEYWEAKGQPSLEHLLRTCVQEERWHWMKWLILARLDDREHGLRVALMALSKIEDRIICEFGKDSPPTRALACLREVVSTGKEGSRAKEEHGEALRWQELVAAQGLFYRYSLARAPAAGCKAIFADNYKVVLEQVFTDVGSAVDDRVQFYQMLTEEFLKDVEGKGSWVR